MRFMLLQNYGERIEVRQVLSAPDPDIAEVLGNGTHYAAALDAVRSLVECASMTTGS